MNSTEDSKLKTRAASRHYLKNMTGTVVTTGAVLDRMHRYVNLAKAMFRKGATSNGRTFNVTFAVKKSKIIAIGLNDYDRQMVGYNRKLKATFKKFGESTYVSNCHAEMSSLLKLGLDDCSDLDFYNVRLNRGCHCCNSQPCSNCLHMLKNVGYKHIYFYDNDMRICKV